MGGVDQSTSVGSATGEVHAATKYLRNDRASTATKVLCSNGAPVRSPAVADELSNQQFQRDKPLQFHPHDHLSLHAPFEDVHKNTQTASKAAASIGTFGWAMDFMVHFAFRIIKPDTALSFQVSRLIEIATAADLPIATTYLMIDGAMTALHKEDKATQATTTAAGKPAPIRSINSGTTFLKQAMRCMSNHSSFDRVKTELAICQYGLGFRNGPEVLCQLARSHLALGYAINTQDAIKGFHKLKRQAVLDGVNVVWPEANKHFAAYYGPPAPCLYKYADADGNSVYRVSFSTEGTRAGCVLGSAGFDIALHHFVYKHLITEFPANVIRAITDDMPNFFTAHDDASWHEEYLVQYRLLKRYDELGNPIGMFRHPDKGKLFLPPEAPTPHPNCPLLKLTTIVADGVKICGAFYGTDTAVIQHGIDKVKSLQHRISAIVSLSTIAKNSHAAMRLLGQVGNNCLSYYQRVTPPTLAMPAALAFDTMIQQARIDILQESDHADPGNPPILTNRAHRAAELPIRHGGLGHSAATTLAASAFLASVRATQHDPLLSQHHCQQALRQYTDPAYELLAFNLKAPISSFPAIVRLLPTTAAALANAPASPSTRLTKTTGKKIQSALMGAVLTVARLDLRTTCHPNNAGQDDLSLPAACHIHLITARSQQSRMMIGSLWFDSNVVVSGPFIAYLRYYLGLLPLLRPWCPSTARYPSPGRLNVCASGHPLTTLLVPDGGHCISCPACFGLRHAAHERINKVYAAFARESGSEVNFNPSTDLMMGGLYGAAARVLFPKHPTPARINTANTLLAALRDASSSNGPATRAAGQTAAAAIIANAPRKQEGLRVDCIIQLNNHLLWLDIGVVHPTAASKLQLVANFVSRLHTAERDSGGNLALNALAQTSSPTVVAYGKVKVVKYSPLVADAAKQVLLGKRASTPVLVPCIFSHAGEMSSESMRVIELITRQYASLVSSQYFEDGVTLKRRTAQFRCRFKDALMAANANGFGTTLAHAGTPRAGKLLSPADAFGGLPDWESVY